MKWFKSLREPIQVAFISGIFALLAAIISAILAGIFLLESKTPSQAVISPTGTSQITAIHTTIPQSTVNSTATQMPSPTIKPAQTSPSPQDRYNQITNSNQGNAFCPFEPPHHRLYAAQVVILSRSFTCVSSKLDEQCIVFSVNFVYQRLPFRSFPFSHTPTWTCIDADDQTVSNRLFRQTVGNPSFFDQAR